ncbi:hypothetical protein D3C84_1255120 [compost metagenome]
MMQKTAATLELAVMPSTSGFASGFRSIVWNVLPDNPKAKPANSPASIRGSRIVSMVKVKPLTSPPSRTRTMSLTG